MRIIKYNVDVKIIRKDDCKLQIYGIDLKVYFLLFIIYAVIGWCMEVICKLIQYKKFVDRGFLIGPYCPIYGVGALLITFFLNKYVQDPVVLFVMAVVVCGILEYLTSYFMEKIYHARWWDYSSKNLILMEGYVLVI